ncbi:MAG TPA: hypothetical protein VF730_01935 [Terracidiphilus sp.]
MRITKAGMRKISLAATALIVLALTISTSAQAPDIWSQPAAALAGKIADLLGPGQAQLTLMNLSSVPPADVPAIQKLLVDDLRARGVTIAGSDSATAVRVTLSESATERLWVAQVVEGDDTQVAMVDAGPVSPTQPQPVAGLVLRRERIFAASEPVLATLQTDGGLVVLEPERIAIFERAGIGWQERQHAEIVPAGALSRDPRGMLLPVSTGAGFVASLPGTSCTGNFLAGPSARDWTIGCHASDDPWIILSGAETSTEPGRVAPALPAQAPGSQTYPMRAPGSPAPTLKAFYNVSRNYFTGTLVPNPAVNIPPFYSAAFIPGAAGSEDLLTGGIDGKVQLLANSALTSVGGTSDWGSDFAALHSGCGAGTQIIASAAGQRANDSLRAYDVRALEAVPASEPLTLNGEVTALWTAPDGKSILAVVRNSPTRYEVDRVSATCN